MEFWASSLVLAAVACGAIKTPAYYLRPIYGSRSRTSKSYAKKSCCLLQVCVYSARPPRLGSKWAAADYTSPTTTTTARNICGTVGPFPCEFGGFFFGINQHPRDPARSRKDRSERGRHHTKGTRYVAHSDYGHYVVGFSCHLVSAPQPYHDHTHAARYVFRP